MLPLRIRPSSPPCFFARSLPLHQSEKSDHGDPVTARLAAPKTFEPWLKHNGRRPGHREYGQFAEDLSDRQAADAVRARIEWKYVLGLDDPGFDFSVLDQFLALASPRMTLADSRLGMSTWLFAKTYKHHFTPRNLASLRPIRANSVVLVELLIL